MQDSNTTENNPETFIITTFKQSGGIDVVKEYLEQEYSNYSEKIESEVPVIDTEEGRKRIKALAAGANKKLLELDTPIRGYLRDIKKQPKLIEAIAKENKDKYTDLRANILKPLQEAQESQDAIIEWLNGVPAKCGDPAVTTGHLNEWIETITGYSADLVWPELRRKFKTAHEAALTTAQVTLERVTQQEAQAAELAELRRKQTEAEQAERERKIREEAEAKAREEAEAKARKEREDIERRAVEAKQREEAAKAAEQKAIRDAELAEEQRKQEAEAAKAREAQAAIEAEQLAKQRAEEASQAEARRIAEAEAEQKREAEARAEDKELRIKVNRANLVVLIAAGFSEEDGKKFIKMVARGELPDIKIHY